MKRLLILSKVLQKALLKYEMNQKNDHNATINNDDNENEHLHVVSSNTNFRRVLFRFLAGHFVIDYLT